MTDKFDPNELFKSNLPDLYVSNRKYNPLKTEAQKKAIAKQWEEYWAVPGNREAWHKAVLEGQDEEWLAKVTAKNKARGQDPEWLAKITEINRQRGANLTDEDRARMSEHSRMMWEDDEFREQMIKESKERWEDDEYRERMIAYTKVPGYSEMMSKRNKEVAQRPEMKKMAKQKGREYSKKYNEDPEFRKRHIEGVENRSNNNKEWIRKNCRPVDTPYGVFEKAKDVVSLYQKEHGGKVDTIGIKLRRWYKSDKHPEWKYLTWDEYDAIIEGKIKCQKNNTH